MENTVIIVDKKMALAIECAILFDNCPFKEATVMRLSNDQYYINFNKFLSNSSLFLCGVYLSEINNLPVNNFVEFEDLNNETKSN